VKNKILNSRFSDFIVWLILCCSVFGCKTAEDHVRLSEDHKQKAISKGAVYRDSIKTVTVKVPVVTDGDTVFVDREVEAPCPEVETPPTRTEIRQNGRTDRLAIRKVTKRYEDSLNHVENMYSDSLDATTDMYEDSLKWYKRINKDNNKTEVKLENCSTFWTWIGKRWWLILIAGITLGLAAPFIIKRLL
jgi:hypothetical protein